VIKIEISIFGAAVILLIIILIQCFSLKIVLYFDNDKYLNLIQATIIGLLGMICIVLLVYLSKALIITLNSNQTNILAAIAVIILGILVLATVIFFDYNKSIIKKFV